LVDMSGCVVSAIREVYSRHASVNNVLQHCTIDNTSLSHHQGGGGS